MAGRSPFEHASRARAIAVVGALLWMGGAGCHESVDTPGFWTQVAPMHAARLMHTQPPP